MDLNNLHIRQLGEGAPAITSSGPATYAISSNGVDNYVQLGLAASDISTLIGTAGTFGYFTVSFKANIPSDVGLSKTLIGFARTASSSTRWELRTHDVSADRFWMYISNDAFSSFDNKGTAAHFTNGQTISVAVVQRERSGFYNPWMTWDVYVNGTVVNTHNAFINGTCTWTTAAVEAIISNTTGQYAKFIMDDLRIYNRDLSGAEVGSIHSGNAPSSGLLAYYTFENNFNDTVGTYNGTASANPPTFVSGL